MLLTHNACAQDASGKTAPTQKPATPSPVDGPLPASLEIPNSLPCITVADQKELAKIQSEYAALQNQLNSVQASMTKSEQK
jgi:hypothetical protein